MGCRELWHRWRARRDADALDVLLAYDAADCVNLQRLADLIYCELVQQQAHGNGGLL
jgi:uncharacterized protein YprB with RNaseH-like and TPR domain